MKHGVFVYKLLLRMIELRNKLDTKGKNDFNEKALIMFLQCLTKI